MLDGQMIVNMIPVAWAILAVILFSIGWYYIGFLILSIKKIEAVPRSPKKGKYAVLIAARNESKVITNLLESLQKQSYDKNYFDPWIIVEDINDPTISIVKKFGFRYFVRDKLTPDRRTKGFAIQECINHFNDIGLHYDAYFVFDADNIVQANFIETMNDLYQSGVQVGIGYRNFTNANKNWVSAGSAILFSYLNQFGSRGRSKLFKKGNLFGTGYYVSSKVIEDAGGWIFTGMTEDVQLTSYCYNHDVYMKYYPYTEFYDEQATDFKQMHNQHVRWVWGFFEPRKKFHGGVKYNTLSKKLYKMALFEHRVSIVPFLTYCICLVLLVLLSLGFAIASFWCAKEFTAQFFGVFLGFAFALYLLFAAIAAVVLLRDNRHLNLSKKMCVVVVLTYAFSFGEFLFAFLDGLFHKEKRTSWKTISHDGKVIGDDAVKAKNN